MEDFYQKLKRAKAGVSLDAQKKNDVRKNLVHFITGTKVVMENAAIRHSMQRSHILVKFMPIFAIIVIVALAGGGTSLAAENALPGDILYPVKIHVNEEVRAAFALNSEARAQWDAERAERRLDEAAELANEDRISAETRADLEHRFEAHANQAEAEFAEIKAGGKIMAAADLASRFEARLKIHEALFDRLEEKSSDKVDVEIGLLKDKVQTELDDVDEARADAEEKIESTDHGAEVKAAAEGKVDAAENVIDSAKSYIENKKEKLGAQTTADAEARLQVAEDLVAQAKAKISAGAYGEAFNLANQAIRVAQEARGLVEAGLHLNIGIGGGPHASSFLFRGRDNENEIEGNERAKAGGEVESEGELNASSGANVHEGLKVKVGL